MTCPVCQSDCLEDETETESRCLDCLAIVDTKTGILLEIDGIRAEVK